MSALLAPDYTASALVIIDFQNDCVLPGAPMEVAGSFEVLSTLAALAQAFRTAGRPMVHVVRGYLSDGSNADLCRREAIAGGKRLLVPETASADFPEALKPAGAPPLDWPALLTGSVQSLGPHDQVMHKPRWGAFYQTPLEAWLCAHGISTLVFAGCNFPNCPRTSIYEASERDFRLVLARDAMSGLYERGLDELRNIGVVLSDSAGIAGKLN